jgi:CxxC motif-containing protein (DUF1111 family)
MQNNALERLRRRVGFGLFGATSLGLAWFLFPGLPVLWAPRASASEKAVGLALFRHEWKPHDPLAKGDGLGPVFNARSCVECHFQGGVGGGGDNLHNVLAFEAHPTRDRPEVKGGLIHKFAVENRFFERRDALREFFPIVPGGIRVEGCQVLKLDFDPVRTQSVNSTALFGAGWIDRISPNSILHHRRLTSLTRIGAELGSEFDGALPGRPHVLPDGRVGKFGWKAQFATLEEFVAAACANEIGLGNPRMPQAQPMVRGGYPEVEPDLGSEQFRSLVAFVDTLPRPTEVAPSDSADRARSERGKALFTSVGCAACHMPEMGGVAGIYSDFLLHRLDDRRNGGGYSSRGIPEVPLPEEHPLPEEWKTPALWGVADSAPYFHDGGAPTLESAILRHHGHAETVTLSYRALPSDDQQAVVDFLKTLRAPADSQPAGSNSPGNLALAK